MGKLKRADMESASLSKNPKFIAIIARARAQRRAGLGFTSDEIRREFGLKNVRRHGASEPAQIAACPDLTIYVCLPPAR